MKKTRDTKTRWNGWIDTEVLTKAFEKAKEKGIPTNYYIEEVLRKAVEDK